MPSARELLEQADALMRRNRARAVDTEIPELTDVVPADAPALVTSRPTALDDVPELTDAVEEIEIQSIVDMPEGAGEPSAWLGFDRGEAHAAAASADSNAETPPAGDASRPDIDAPAPVALPPRASLADAAPVPPPAALCAPADDWARWEALADEIRMEVLQRIEIFTEAGLRERLGVHLQPIVDRASAELVATVNEQVGGLLRAYIAEVIEREIESRRAGRS